MAEKRRLNVLVAADGPPAEASPRTLMPEVLPDPRSHLSDGGARQRTMRHLERLRAVGAPEGGAREGDEAVDSTPAGEP